MHQKTVHSDSHLFYLAQGFEFLKCKARYEIATAPCSIRIHQQFFLASHHHRTYRSISCIWNSLPQDLRHRSTLSSFKAKLKTFLFSQYFHPNCEISTQFLLQSLHVCVCVCGACVCFSI